MATSLETRAFVLRKLGGKDEAEQLQARAEAIHRRRVEQDVPR